MNTQEQVQREIRFRAFDVVGLEMIYPDSVSFLVEFDGTVWENKGTTEHDHLQEKHPSEYLLMQYTGLKDKNGKEGYHNDIVSSGKKLYLISWQDEEARFWLAPQNHSGAWKFMDELDHMEIVGNIYEHPHLLKI